jgi:hypothetical protein
LNIVFIATTILAKYFIGNTFIFLYSRYWHPKIYEKAPRKAGSHR